MRTFSRKPTASQQASFAKSTMPGRADFGQRAEVNSILHLQRTIGNQAVLRMLQTNAEELKAGLTGTTSPRFAHDFSRIPIHPSAVGAIQMKLAINKPGDEYEQEADRVAHLVMTAQAGPAVSGAPLCIQPFSEQSNSQTESAPASVDQALASPGRPLEPELRQDMEQRFGYNFSRVRVHSDTAAEQSAREVAANAYTAGHNIVFGAGRFAPTTLEGRRLIAHELTHVVQQRTAQLTGLARQPAKQPVPTPPQPTKNYQSDVAIMDRANMESWAGVDYWLDRVGSLFAISLAAETAERFKDRGQDAVLAALWRVHPDPAKLHIDETKRVQIPSVVRPEKKQPGEVLYRVVFGPPTKDRPKALVTIFFEAENPKSVLEFAPIPPAGYDQRSSKLAKDIGGGWTQLRYTDEGFQGNSYEYFQQHPDEAKHLFYWIEKQGLKFTQIVITRTTQQKGKLSSLRQTSFMLTGSKDKEGRLVDLNIALLGKSFDLTQVWLPRDYHSKDGGDRLLEKLQDQPDPKKGDLLGKVTLGAVPADEAVPLKYSIWSYFGQMGTRDAEVNATITTIGTKKHVFYKIHFRQNNDVDAERIGEEKAGTKLDPNRLDVASVNGYQSDPDHPEKLKAWLRKRYPRIKPEGTSEVELRESANKSLEAEAGTPEWFRDNYRIHVLDADKGKTRMQSLGWKKPQLSDFKTFKPEELKLAEISLETMSDNFLRLLKETRLVRKKMHVDIDKGTGKFVFLPLVGGITVKVSSSSENTVVIFDKALEHADERFLGGANGVRPIAAMTVTHEFGHVVESATGAKAKFNKLVKDEGIQPFTPSMLNDVEKEFFAEAFFLYNTEPEWLKASQPKVFDFLEAMNAELEKKEAKKKTK